MGPIFVPILQDVPKRENSCGNGAIEKFKGRGGVMLEWKRSELNEVVGS